MDHKIETQSVIMTHLETRESGHRIRFYGAILIAAATFLTYAPSLKNDFVSWDDPLVLMSNPIAKGTTLRNIIGAFSTYDPELYVPLTVLSYQLEYNIAGRQPWIYHLDNLFLHIANAILVLLLLQGLLKQSLPALFGALIFALHPLNTETVVWASARKDLLATFFFLISTLLYIRSAREASRSAYVWSIIAFLLSLLSKTTMITGPALFLLIDWQQRRPWSKTVLLEKAPYLLLALLFSVIAFFGKYPAEAPIPLLHTAIMASKSTVFALQSFFWPFHLSPLYPFTGPITITSLHFLFPITVLCCLFFGSMALLRRSRIFLFSLLFFSIALFPTFFNFSKAGEFYISSDRYAYVPQIGILFLLAAGFAKISVTRHGRTLAFLSLLPLIAFLGFLSMRQSLFWSNSKTLFSHSLSLYPQSFAANVNMYVIASTEKRYDAALAYLEKADALRPGTTKVQLGRAHIFEQQRDRASAMKLCENVASEHPENFEARYCIAVLTFQAGDTESALEEFRRTIALEPDHVGARINMGAIYMDRKDYQRAEGIFREILAYDPTLTDVLFNLGFVLIQQRKLDLALETLQTAHRIDPSDDDILIHIIAILKEQNRMEEARSFAERLLQLRQKTQP